MGGAAQALHLVSCPLQFTEVLQRLARRRAGGGDWGGRMKNLVFCLSLLFRRSIRRRRRRLLFLNLSFPPPWHLPGTPGAYGLRCESSHTGRRLARHGGKTRVFVPLCPFGACTSRGGRHVPAKWSMCPSARHACFSQLLSKRGFWRLTYPCKIVQSIVSFCEPPKALSPTELAVWVRVGVYTVFPVVVLGVDTGYTGLSYGHRIYCQGLDLQITQSAAAAAAAGGLG